MRKASLIAGVILILLSAAIYLLIPSKLDLVVVRPVKCNIDAADRSLRDTANEAKWWGNDSSGFTRPKVTGLFRRMVDVTIDDDGFRLPGRLTVFPSVNIDSCVLQWESQIATGLNPVSRIQRYREAKQLAAGVETILSRLGSRLGNQQLVYGMSITEGNTTDSLLVSTTRTFPQYPSDSAIYTLVGKLRQFVARKDGHETGHPMLNVTHEADGSYKTEVGLPIDKVIKDEGDIRGRALIRVVFLEADVHGGDSTVRTAVRQMGDYINDYHRTIMAIPYQSLITDRMKEKDTTKWVTRLYVPVYPIH